MALSGWSRTDQIKTVDMGGPEFRDTAISLP